MKAQDWLPEFFAVDNKIDLIKALEQRYEPHLQALLSPLIEPAWKGQYPLIVPYSADHLWFYGMAQDDRSLHELQRVLVAALGSADIYPEISIITTPANDAERVLIKAAPFGVLKFAFLDLKGRNSKETNISKKRVFTTLGSLIHLFERRPRLTVQLRRPIGAVLRDFLVACQTNDGDAAVRYYDEIKNLGVLSQRNLKFLELQKYAAGKQWSRISEYESLPEIMLGKIPLRMQRLLVRVMGHEILNAVQHDGFPKSSLDKAKRYCLRFLPIVQKVPAFPHEAPFTEDWKLWALANACQGLVPWPQLPAFIDQHWISKAKEWAGQENDNLPETQEAKPATENARIISLADASTLLQRTLAPDFEQGQISDIVDQLQSMPKQTEKELANHPYLNQIWLQIKADEAKKEQLGWTLWFEQLFSQGVTAEECQQLYQQVLNFSSEWPTDSLDADTVQKLLENELDVSAATTLRNSLPLLTSWLNDHLVVCGHSFWCSLLELLALDDALSDEDVRLANLLLEQFLGDTFNISSYINAIEALVLLLDGLSPKAFNYALDTMELLLESRCPDTQQRMRIWSQLQSQALDKWNRLQLQQQTLLRLLADEMLGESGASIFPAAGSEDAQYSEDLPGLGNKLLAIYSLTEGAARRAKQTLEQMFSGLKVELNHDHEHTAALANLAKKADYFVFAWGSSKHQAYFGIKKYRNEILYPSGKGTSSLISCVMDRKYNGD